MVRSMTGMLLNIQNSFSESKTYHMLSYCVPKIASEDKIKEVD